MFKFECETCGKTTEFFEHSHSDLTTPTCSSCDTEMSRSYDRFSTGSTESSSGDDESLPGNLSEQNPKDMINNVANSYKSMDQDPGREFNEAVDRINKGENPDKVHDFVKGAKEEKGNTSSEDD
ncbi:MAG: hypothetical protein ABEK50_11980 [bacterium]